jgi:hypothetical protein
MKSYEEWRYNFTFVDLGSRWKWMVSFAGGKDLTEPIE